ncbi:MAG: hypothetical protein WBF53_05090 [Litorimonas sp.]
MQTRDSLLAQIDAFIAATGKSPTALCRAADVDHHVIRKLRQGKSITLRSIERLEDYMATCQLPPEWTDA